MKKKIVLLFLFLISSLAVSAQRTARGTYFIDASAVCTFQSLGGQASFGYFLLNSYVTGGVNIACRSVSQDTGALKYNLPYVQYTATGDFLYRFYGTRTRFFTVNGGGGILLGAEVYDPKNQRPEGVTLSETGAKFIYGVDVRLEMELYVFRRVGFTLGGRLPLTFGSLCSVFNYEASLGLRINI